MTLLPVEAPAGVSPKRGDHRWLVTAEHQFRAGASGGIVEQRARKACSPSFLALDVRGRVQHQYAVPAPVRRSHAPDVVLLFAAEDALHIVRSRLEGICAAAGLALAGLDIQVITAPILRLDLDADRRNLADTVARLVAAPAYSRSVRAPASHRRERQR